MAGSWNIPLTTLTPGVHFYPLTGGEPVAGADTAAQLTVDRTVANGLNATPAVTQADIAVSLSPDGGASWYQAASAGLPGGIFTDKHGATVNSFSIGLPLPAGADRQARAQVTISGSSVAVAGTLTVS